MGTRSESLLDMLSASFGETLAPSITLDEVSVDVPAVHLHTVCQRLHDEPEFQFTQLVDLCGVDYSTYGVDEWSTETSGGNSFSRGVNEASIGRLSFGDSAALPERDTPRFAVVLHLLSISNNLRLRVRCYAPEDDFAVVPTVTGIWACADWYEREAFDLYGILFEGHDDLRRLLTDYGFVGHPFRKDFPLIGNVEMRFDPAKGRVVYEPVTIEPRVLVPRVIRHDSRYVDPSVAAAAADAKES